MVVQGLLLLSQAGTIQLWAFPTFAADMQTAINAALAADGRKFNSHGHCEFTPNNHFRRYVIKLSGDYRQFYLLDLQAALGTITQRGCNISR